MTTDKIINKINDFLGYVGTDTIVEQNQKISAINSAISFLLGDIDFENSIRTYTIQYNQEQLVYSLPSDFVSLISLHYALEAEPYVSINNQKRWLFETPELIIKRNYYKPSDAVLYSIEGNKIYILTSNIFPALSIERCESTDGWTALDDATNLGVVSTYKKEGDFSLKFDIDVNLSPVDRASVRKTFTPSLSLKTYENKSSFTLWLYIRSTTNLSSISFNWGTDIANYYKTTITTQADGSPLVVGWNFLKFNWVDAVIVGNPNPDNITFIKLDIDYTSAFTSSTNWFLDDIMISVYDPIVVKYYTNLVIRDTAGNLKSTITALTDDVLIVQNELALNTIALLSILHYRGAPATDKAYIQSLYQLYYSKLKTNYPPKKILGRLGRFLPPIIR